jgi:Methyltransferase domain
MRQKIIILQRCLKYFHLVLGYPKHASRIRQLKRLTSIEEKFTWIHNKNMWDSSKSVSGTGSTLDYTENLRRELSSIFQKYLISEVLDAPCGDFNWMSEFLKTVNVSYVGVDIVKSLIDDLEINFGQDDRKFIHLDLTSDDLPQADLMFCRDCLFHLSYKDTKAALQNFIESGIPYLLTTTHENSIVNGFENKDIETGDFRLMDLFSAPYYFPTDCLETLEDWRAPEPRRYMCLWNREQIKHALLISELV